MNKQTRKRPNTNKQLNYETKRQRPSHTVNQYTTQNILLNNATRHVQLQIYQHLFKLYITRQQNK